MTKLVHREWQAPTGVGLSAVAHLCSPLQRNLVVARASLLQIYVLRDGEVIMAFHFRIVGVAER